MERGVDAETVEQNASVGFGGISAFFADDAFELAESHAVLVSELVVRLGVKGVALFKGGPESGVAHDDGVEDAEPVESELVLTKDTDAFGAVDIAAGGFLLSGENFHEGGFAGAIGAGDGIAAAVDEGGGDVLKEDTGAEAHSDVIYGDHILTILAYGAEIRKIRDWRPGMRLDISEQEILGCRDS